MSELIIDIGGPIQGRLVPVKNLTGIGPDYYTTLEKNNGKDVYYCAEGESSLRTALSSTEGIFTLKMLLEKAYGRRQYTTPKWCVGIIEAAIARCEEERRTR